MNTTVVLFPGLGADHRLFRFQHAVLPDLVIPPWPATAANDSLASFAGRFVDSIPKVDGLYLGGSSFGGMVALELASLVQPKAVILIGSCTSPSAITALARHMRSLAAALPVSAFHPRRWSLPFLLP